MQKTCIVVPCYNEAKRLPADSFRSFLTQNPYSFFFVNDGSTDNTLGVLKKIKSFSPEKVEIINLNKNSGKAEAVRQGFLAALEKNEFQYIGYLDADLATPLEEIAYLLLNFRPEIKVVIGSRVQRLGALIERRTLRHYAGRVFATLASLTLDIKVYDSQCGAKIFKTETAKNLFENSFQSKWLFDLELLCRLKNDQTISLDTAIMEVPLRTWTGKGDSKIKPLDFITAPFELIRIRKNTLKK